MIKDDYIGTVARSANKIQTSEHFCRDIALPTSRRLIPPTGETTINKNNDNKIAL